MNIMDEVRENQFSDPTSDLNSAAEAEAYVLHSSKPLPSDAPRISVDAAATGQGTQIIPKDYLSADHNPDKSKISAPQEADKVVSTIRAESKAAASSTRPERTKVILDKEETSKQVTQIEGGQAVSDSGDQTNTGAEASNSASDVKPKANTSVSLNKERSEDMSGGPETSIAMQSTESETYKPASNTREETNKLAENSSEETNRLSENTSEEISTTKSRTRQEGSISASNNGEEINPPTPNTGERISAAVSNTRQEASLNVTKAGQESSRQKSSTFVSNSRHNISSPMLYNREETNKSASHAAQVMSTDVRNTKHDKSTPVSNAKHETGRPESNTSQETGTIESDTMQETGPAVSETRQETGSAVSENRQETGTAVSDTMQETGTAVSDTMQETGTAVSDTRKETGTAVSDTRKETGTAVSGTRKETGTAVSNTRKETGTAVSDTMQETGTAVSDTRKETGPAVSDTRKETGTAVSGTRKETGTAVSDTMQEAGTAVSDTMQETGTAVSDTRKETGTAVSDTRKETGTAVSGTRKETGTAVSNTRKETGTAVSDTMQETGTAVSDTMQETGTAVSDTRKETGTAVSDTRKETGTAVSGTRKETGTAVSNTRKETGTAVSDTMQETGTAVSDTRKETGPAVSDTRKETGPAVSGTRKETGTAVSNARKETSTAASDTRKETGPAVSDTRKETGTMQETGTAVSNTRKETGKPASDTRHETGTGISSSRQEVNLFASARRVSKEYELRAKNTTGNPNLHKKWEISKVEHKLLLMENIRKDLVYELSNTGNEVDKVELEKGRIRVLRGDADDVFKIFKSKIKTDHVCVNAYMTGVEHQIADIAKKFSDWLKVEQEGQWYDFAFHTDIEAEVLPKLANLHIATKFYSLPSYIVRYIRCHLQCIRKTIQKQLGVELMKLEITPLPDPPGILVDSDGYPGIQQVLDRLFSDLQYTEFETETETAVFLQTVLGDKQVRDIESKYHCQIRVRSPIHQMELKAVSPRKCHLLLYHGDVQYTDCQVLVLPFCEGQTEWCPQYKKILERGFLSTEVKPYASKLGPSPSQQFILPLRPTLEGMEKHVVVMYVPEPTSDKMRDFITTACKQAFDFAYSQKLSLAFPVKLSDGLPVKTFKTMLYAIREHMEREDTVEDVVLYISDTSQLKTLMDISSKYLMQCEGWFTDVIFRADSMSGSSHHINIAVDELQKFKADVLVNSTDCRLEHTNAAVSRLILKTVGPQLQESCSLLYPSGIEDRILAVTPSGIDQWKEIYHIVLPQKFWEDQYENCFLDELRKRVQGCLTVASANNHETIAFPTLGTGKLRYPPKKVAITIFNTARDFFATMPHSSLKEVTIVCFPKDTEIIKVFKAEEALHTFRVDKSLDQEARLDGGKRLVQIVVPNTGKEEIPDICDIVYDFTPDEAHKKQKGAWQKDKTKSLREIIKKKDKREAVSLQINLMRAGSEDFADIVKAVGKKLSKCSKCLIVIMAVPNVSSLQSVCQEFQAPQKTSSLWDALSWFTGGKSEIKSPVNRSFSKSLPKRETGVICVCGNSKVIAKVKAEMKKIYIPEKYRQLAAELNDEDCVDPDLGAVNNVAKQNVGRTKKEECTLTIPIADLPELDENAFSPALNPVINHEKDCLTFFVPFKDLPAAVDEVTAVIKSANDKSQKRDVPIFRQNKQIPLIERTVDCLEYEALKYLLGESFILTKTDEKDGKVTFSIPPDRGPEDIDDKIDSLRQETVSLEEDNMSKIENPINTRSEGVEAFMKIIQQERKVVIFCFDFNNMNKAKHLLQVKTGRIKPTSRATRKFGEGLASSSSQQSSADSYSKPADCLDLYSKSGIKVSVYKTDITKLPVDAIVNAANQNLQHGGGVAAAIAKAAGPTLEEEGDDYINKHGSLKVTQVVSTTAGALPCKAVLHAVGPRWGDYQDKMQCQEDLQQTVFNCLELAHNMKFGSLAVSSISSAIFGVPKNVCAEMYMQAVQTFDDHYGAASCLKHIHFADISDEMVSNIQTVFTQKMNNDASCQHGGNIQAVRSLETAQQNLTGMMQEVPPVSTKQQNKGETTQPDNSANAAQQNAKDKIQSTAIVDSTQHDMTQSVTCVDSTQQSTNPTTPAPASDLSVSAVLSRPSHGSDFHSITSLNKESAATATQSCGAFGLQWKISFYELEYFIVQQGISQITTDVIITWHTDGRPIDERSLKKLLTPNDFSAFKKKQLAEGKIHIFQGSKCKWLVFVVVPRLTRDSLEAVTSIVEKALQKADSLEGKSVALPKFFHSKDVRQDNEHQAKVFSSALEKFAGRPTKSLRILYIVDLEEEFISLLRKEMSASILRIEDQRRLLSERKTTLV